MGTVRWLLTGFILLASPLIADTPSPARHSLADIRCELCAPLFSGATDTSVRAALMQTGAAGRKAPALAAIYSLVLPGMGELYAGDFSSGNTSS